MSADRRGRDLRVQASMRVQFRTMDEFVVAYTGNLSRGGIRLRTDSPLPIGSHVELRIELPDGLPEVTVPSTVVFVKPPQTSGGKHDVGVKFIDPDSETRRRLEWFILNSDPEPGQFGPSPHTRRLDLVIADDDPAQRKAAAAPFQARSDQVRLAADGLEAFSQCLQKTPDAVLTDVQMPKMDGWQLLRMLRARPNLSRIPVLFLTTLRGEQDRLLGYRMGVDDYLEKPPRAEELVVRVDRAVARAGQMADTVAQAEESALRGDLEQVSLASVLAFLEMEQKSGVLRTGPRVNATVALREGRPVSVLVSGFPHSDPAEWLFRLLDLNEGRFEFVHGQVNEPDTVRWTVTALLLEHARRHDEAGRVG
ncbi:TIGR02266 family protein [Myxococcota bacterium]